GCVVGELLLTTCLTAKQLPLVLTERQLDARASLSERVRTDAVASLARRVGASAARVPDLLLQKISPCKALYHPIRLPAAGANHSAAGRAPTRDQRPRGSAETAGLERPWPAG